MKILIRGGRLVDPAQGLDAPGELCIAAGRVVGCGRVPDGFVANRVIEAGGRVVAPGLVDLSARLREPGFEYLATLESEMAAAVAGGVTSLACPPDTDPALDEPGLVEMLKYRAQGLNQCRVYPVGALTTALAGQRLTEMAELRDAGCVAFSQAGSPIADTQVLARALSYAATFDFCVWLQPQDAYLGHGGFAHDGEVATRLGLPAIPVTTETVAIATIVLLMRDTGARVHLCRVSSAAGLEMIRAARAEGLPLSCDVGVHHLHLSDVDIGWFDSNCHLSPPLRAVRDRDALRAGAASGLVDAVCSDHSPVDEDNKQVPFAESEAGATALELLLPLTLKWGREMGLGLGETLARVTTHPARILGVQAGSLAEGVAADVCIFDPAQEWLLAPDSLVSQGKNTPFVGYPLQGRVTQTLVGGNLVFDRQAAER
ncbi:MAG: dihydroorotase [Pseudomonadota bacterium]|nr:dihydroorotase [Pseudomonadota bacterium]